MNYNTTYLETLGCEQSTVILGRMPYNVLNLKLGIKPKWKTTPNSDVAEQLQKQIDEVRATAKDNIMLSYLKTKNTTTAKRLQLRSKKMITATSLIRKLTTSRQNSHCKVASGQART